MITKETAVKIWNCYNEIENAEKLMADMAETLKKDKEKTMPTFQNAFGERVGLELGVPCGNGAHRLFSVNTELSVKIIEKHIEEKKVRLQELKTIAMIELKGAA